MTTDAATTETTDAGAVGRLGTALRDVAGRLEETAALDEAAAQVRARIAPVLRQPRAAAVLRGAPLGHAAHPLLTDLPIGLWVSASALDLLALESAGRAAQRLVGLGVLAVAPTSMTGLADWAAAEGHDPAVRRVGVAHALLNVAATSLYGASWLLRRRGRRTAGVVVALLGGGVLAASGYLGGHLVVVRHAPHDEPVGSPGEGPGD